MAAYGCCTLDWKTDGSAWPNRQFSRFHKCRSLTWHFQMTGSGPVALLLHGTGASTHSWRALVPCLAPHFTILAVDLPGHGFTTSPKSYGMSLDGMARLLRELLDELEIEPVLGIGHSAGAAILIEMALHGCGFKGIIGLNAALRPFGGNPGRVFAPLARLAALNPVTPLLFSLRARDRKVIRRLLDQTGSEIDDEGADYYRRLASNPGHAAAALKMMANWNLQPLTERLGSLETPLLLIAGDRDGMVPPEVSEKIGRQVAAARSVLLDGLGHLAHEEAPEVVAGKILHAARDWDILPPEQAP